MEVQNGIEKELLLHKKPTGIDGLDTLTGGGLPAERTTLVVGGPGSGKTILAIQTLVNAITRCGERGVLVTFEETMQQLLINAASLNWKLQDMIQQGNLLIIDGRMHPSTIQIGRFDFAGMLADIKKRANELGARWVVFDAIDVLLSLLNNTLTERQELYRLRDWLNESNLTGIITAKIEGSYAPETLHYGFMQFLADCVILLEHRLARQISLRSLRITKYRGAGVSNNEFPLVIGPQGMEIAGIGTLNRDQPVSSERVTTGIERLDTMLTGGYHRSSSILISGAPGTAKTSLATACIAAACARNDRALYVSFDESSHEMIRNMASIGLQLQRFVEAGLLYIHTSHAEIKSPEEHFLTLRGLIETHQPQMVAIDPLSSMLNIGDPTTGIGVVQRLLHTIKSQSITVLVTSLLDTPLADAESTPLHVSTLADTWLHLSYVIQGGERNRALTIVKSRGMHHSNQVRELILSNSGMTLSDVYTAEGEVLMGTLRWQKEQQEAQEREASRAEVEYKRRKLETEETRINAQIAELKHDLEIRKTELAALLHQQSHQEQHWQETEREISRLRNSDTHPPDRQEDRPDKPSDDQATE